ncbi:MAG: glycosyltransferase family 39 protein [Candidatus Woesebacteria bacterium]|nr:MAG: glycosyltransferase family 39 protein [Candidatus Woesebacteria bacterium]
MFTFIKRMLSSRIFLLLFFGLFFRVVLSFFGTLNLDQGTFVAWSINLARDGFRNFYNGWSDYLPGYLYVLWLLAKINLFGIFPTSILYKLPAIISDLLTGLIIYKILRKSKGEKWGLVGSAIYIFNPAVFANSALWGQVDSLTSLFSVLSVYLLPFSLHLSAVGLAIGTLVKPQTAFIFPVILFLLIKNKKKFSDFLVYGITGLIVFVAGFIPFWNHGNLISFIFERLGLSLNQYPYTSVNAFNFWGLIGLWKPDNVVFQVCGYVLFIAATVFLSFKLWKQKNPEYYLTSFIFAVSFVFFTRMHERHLLPLFAPLAIVAIENPVLMIPYLSFSLTYVANLYYAYVWISSNFKEVFSDFFIKILELINIGSVFFMFTVIAKKINKTWLWFKYPFNRVFGNKKQSIVKYKLPQNSLSKNKAKYILIGILAFAFVTRIYNLNSPKTEYFDEVYHAFTAKVMIHADANKAWEWWNTPPEGFAYEWTHPPLAKLGMVMGMKIFGEDSFGWRVPGAILGVGSVLLVYLLAKFLFKDELTGLLSAAVFSLDGLVLVMSRIGMNDSYLLFFVLLSIYFFLQKKDFRSAVSFGLAISSKWSAIWAIPILGIIWLKRKNKFRLSTFAFFLVIPFIIYLSSYIQMFLTGHGLDIWWGMQEQMWWYHTGLKATHAYSSSWWSWPFLIRPIYLYTSNEVAGWVARIYAMGNPLVFWFGMTSVVMGFVYAFMEKNKKIGFVVFSYLIFFVPWALSPRIMFLYHYLPSIPFLAIAIGYILRRNPKLIFPFLVFSFSLFLYFYPHWIGLQIPLWLDRGYYWVASWR